MRGSRRSSRNCYGGGEPFARVGWDEILLALCDAKIGVVILTNGTLIWGDNIRALKRRGITLSISLGRGVGLSARSVQKLCWRIPRHNPDNETSRG